MKTVAIIWICALISGITCAKVVDNTLNSVHVGNLQGSNYQVQDPASLDLGNSLCLQACHEPQLQSTKNVQ